MVRSMARVVAVSLSMVSGVLASLQISRTDLNVQFLPDNLNNVVRIFGSMRSNLSVDVDTLLKPAINKGYVSCAFTDTSSGLKINFAQSRRRMRFNTWIRAGQYYSRCNFSSVIDAANERAQFSLEKDQLYFGTTSASGSIFPCLDRDERSVYSLSVTVPSQLNVEVLSNAKQISKSVGKRWTRFEFEDTPPLSVAELGLALGKFRRFVTSSSGADGEIDIFSREGHKRTLEIRHGDPVGITVLYLREDDTPMRRHAAELTANLMPSFVDLIHAFWEIQAKVGKVDVILFPSSGSAAAAAKSTSKQFSTPATAGAGDAGALGATAGPTRGRRVFAAPGLIALSEEVICRNKSTDRSCEYVMLKQLSTAALSGYIGCLSSPASYARSEQINFNAALIEVLARKMLLRLGVIAEGNLVPLDVEEFQSNLASATPSKCEHAAAAAAPSDHCSEQSKAKFGALLRMLEQQIGTVAFNGAVRKYLFRYADCEIPAGVEQFRECVAELGSGKRRTHRAFFHQVSQFIEAFVQRPGVPVVSVRRLPPTAASTRENTTRLEITQQLECGADLDRHECPVGNWTIPLKLKVVTPNATSDSLRRITLSEPRSEITLDDAPESATILVDQSPYGYYRVYYHNLSNFLRLDESSVPDIALLFDYLHFAEKGFGMAALPLLVHTSHFLSRPSKSLMSNIEDKLLAGPYLRMLAANDAVVESRLRCLFRNLPELYVSVRDDPDLKQFRSMTYELGWGTAESLPAENFTKSEVTAAGATAAVVRELSPSYVTALSLRSASSCGMLKEALAYSSRPASARTPDLWAYAFTSSPECLQELLAEIQSAGAGAGGALRSFITSMARGSSASHRLLWDALIKHRLKLNELQVPLSEIVLSFVKWHSESPVRTSRTVDFLEQAQQLLQMSTSNADFSGTTSLGTSTGSTAPDRNSDAVAPTAPGPGDRDLQREQAALPDTIRLLLERNYDLVRRNRDEFIEMVDSMYCEEFKNASQRTDHPKPVAVS